MLSRPQAAAVWNQQHNNIIPLATPISILFWGVHSCLVTEVICEQDSDGQLLVVATVS